MKILFFDFKISGHHPEYISHLVEHISRYPTENEYFFVVHPDFSIQFPEIVHLALQTTNILWIEIPYADLAKNEKGGRIRKSISAYKLMHKYAVEYQVDHVCLLHINLFQIPLAFYRPHFTLSGILFLQFSRMERRNLKDKMKYCRKHLTTKLYSLNQQIQRIFVLNDKKSAEHLNSKFRTDIFKVLPDPIPQILPLENFDIYQHYGIEVSRKILLHIGSLGERKGTFETIETASYIPAEHQKDFAILIVGKAGNTETEEKISKKMETSKSDNQVQVIWDNQFVPSKFMKSLFDQCYAVLIPYKNPEASSGILGHAAAANKPVIATGKGLLKDLIEENNLGVLISEANPKNIAAAVMTCDLTFEKPDINFVKNHTPQHFSRLLTDTSSEKQNFTIEN